MGLKSTYDKIAEDWHEDHKNDDWLLEGTDAFISFLSKGNLILDVGCGTGIKAKYLIDHGLKVIGIDFSDKMIEIAKRENPAGDFRVLDLKDISKIQEDFDAVFAQAVLLHIPKNEAESTLKSLIAKLKPSGYLYVAVKESRPGKSEEEIKEEEDYGYKYERFFSYFTKDEIKKYLIDIGLKIVYEIITTSGKTNWIQIVGQK